MTGLADSAYTATDSGWGVWFVAAVLLLAGLFAVAVWAVRAAGRWARSLVARRRVGRHELAPPHPRHLPIRGGRR